MHSAPPPSRDQTTPLIVAAALGVALAFACLSWRDALWATAFWFITVRIAWEDTQTLMVFDFDLAILMICGLAHGTFWSLWAGEMRQAIWTATELAATVAVLGAGAYALAVAFRLVRNVEGLGLGDIKLIAASGTWLSVEAAVQAVGFAAVTALAFMALVAVKSGGFPRADRRIPFAAFLAPCFWCVWVLRQLDF